jgi:hypothetical protein
VGKLFKNECELDATCQARCPAVRKSYKTNHNDSNAPRPLTHARFVTPHKTQVLCVSTTKRLGVSVRQAFGPHRWALPGQRQGVSRKPYFGPGSQRRRPSWPQEPIETWGQQAERPLKPRPAVQHVCSAGRWTRVLRFAITRIG